MATGMATRFDAIVIGTANPARRSPHGSPAPA